MIDAQLLSKAQNHDPEAHYQIGLHYATESNSDFDHTEAYAWFVKAAELGSVDAMLELVKINYSAETGEGIVEATKWAERAAEAGHTTGMFLAYLGNSMKGHAMIKMGCASQPETAAILEKAKYYLEEALKNGYNSADTQKNSDSLFKDLGDCYFASDRNAEAFDCYKKTDDPKASIYLSLLVGKGVTMPDDENYIYNRLAMTIPSNNLNQEDNGWGYHMLGIMTQNGIGTQQNTNEAYNCFVKAKELGFSDADSELFKYKMSDLYNLAENGDVNAIIEIAEIKFKQYQQEQSISDAEEAIALYRKALEISPDNVDSREKLKYAAAMIQIQESSRGDKAESVKYGIIAANMGDARAMAWVGQAYRDGSGTERDYTKATEWFEESALLGDERGIACIEDVYPIVYGDSWHVQYVSFMEMLVSKGYKEAQERLDNYYTYLAKPLPSEKSTSKPEPAKKSSCYIATAVYGSYDCPEVWVLRRFRDNVLSSKTLGRVFIQSYYAISPTIVKWFGDVEWFRSSNKKMLDTLIKVLKENGIQDTSYYD